MFVIPADADAHPVRFDNRLLDAAEHEHLREHEPDVGFLLREKELVNQGRRILGTCHMPQVQGRLGPLFDWMLERTLGYVPVFLFVLDAEWWRQASDREREILMFHEMLHAGIAKDNDGCPRFNRQTGEPSWAIRGHDIEEFNEVVARYGAWSPDVQAFLAAVKRDA